MNLEEEEKIWRVEPIQWPHPVENPQLPVPDEEPVHVEPTEQRT